jgi:pimeloyl-ACP methyl ester carboxylesterase
MFVPQVEIMLPVSIPVLLVYGERDQFLSEESFLRSEARCTGPFRYERLDTGHWMPTEQPTDVTRLLLDFLG